MKELAGLIGLVCFGILWLEDSSKYFILDGNVKLTSLSGEAAPLIGNDIYLVDDLVFKKAEGIAIQKTKEEVSKFEAIVKKKMELFNTVEEFKGKSLEEITARALIAPLTEPENAASWIKLQQNIAELYKEKNYLNRSDLIFNKFLFGQISYTLKDKTDVNGRFTFNVPTKGTWHLMCENKDEITFSGSTNKVEANTLFWFVRVPMEGFKSSALFGKYRMPFQPLHVEHLDLSMNNVSKPNVK